MSDELKKFREKMEEITNVIVIDDNDKPLGIIFKWELKESWKDSARLVDHINSVGKDYITKTEWTIDGVTNFASLSKKDTLLDAKKRMDGITQSIDNRLSARGLVFDDEKKQVIGIINFANISAELI